MTAPYYADEHVTLYHGDCLEVLGALPDCSVHAVVTDPPYGISFMGKQWDQPGEFGSKSRRGGGPNHRRGQQDAALEAGRYDLSPHAMGNFQRWCEVWATECLRILKPGGHLLSFGGSRTWHRLACAVEDAGFEIRDSIAWLYGEGFPKSLDVSKAIDKAEGAQREVLGEQPDRWTSKGTVLNFATDRPQESVPVTAGPATAAAAAAWDGWGTALKPAFEPIVVARKPLSGTVAQTVLEHGTGALNIDGCRIETTEGLSGGAYADVGRRQASDSLNPSGMNRPGATVGHEFVQPPGRWPTNVILDESQADSLDAQSGIRSSGMMRAGTERQPRIGGTIYGADTRSFVPTDTYGDTGGASRYFPVFRYEAKAGASERPRIGSVAHPTVKPLNLMRWLVRLVTPPGGTVLEPFAGSGTTAEACVIEGFRCIAIEREADYLPLIMSRLTKPIEQVLNFDGGAA